MAVTSPRNKADDDAINIPATNPHAWLNRACALVRWALNPRTNETLKWILIIQAKQALQRSKQ